MNEAPLRVAALGMGWWSDVLADAAKRSGTIEIVACFTRSEDKRRAFAAKYGCRAADSYQQDPKSFVDRRHARRCHRAVLSVRGPAQGAPGIPARDLGGRRT